jgi:hypothetical protein
MESNETGKQEEQVEITNETTQEVANTETTNEETINTEVAEEVAEVESKYTEADFLNYAKSKGREALTFDELFKEKEAVEKIVNPYEGLIDEEDEQYYKYKKETGGRTRKEFESLNRDYDKVDSLELARERIRTESGSNLTDEQADKHLERKLGIDLSDLQDMEEYDKIELASYTKSIRDGKKADQQKYKQPIVKKEEEVAEPTVNLDNGTTMKQTDYDVLVKNQQTHITKAIESANSVANSSFKVEYDDNGTKRELNYGYESSTEDKQRLVSMVSDISGYMNKNFGVGKDFRHSDFDQNAQWMDREFREKAISSMLNSARAEAIEENAKVQNNVNYDRNPLARAQGEGKIVTLKELFNR